MSITLDPEHGVNPSLEQCFVCMKDVGVVLFGKLHPRTKAAFAEAGITRGDGEAPHKICLSMEPCNECKGYMTQGIILISVDESKSPDHQNPWRTGGWVVVTEDYIRRAMSGELLDNMLDARMAFVSDELWDIFGLPRGEKEAEQAHE